MRESGIDHRRARFGHHYHEVSFILPLKWNGVLETYENFRMLSLESWDHGRLQNLMDIPIGNLESFRDKRPVYRSSSGMCGHRTRRFTMEPLIDKKRVGRGGAAKTQSLPATNNHGQLIPLSSEIASQHHQSAAPAATWIGVDPRRSGCPKRTEEGVDDD